MLLYVNGALEISSRSWTAGLCIDVTKYYFYLSVSSCFWPFLVDAVLT